MIMASLQTKYGILTQYVYNVWEMRIRHAIVLIVSQHAQMVVYSCVSSYL